MEDKFLKKLNLLLEQEQCEFVDIPDGFYRTDGEWRITFDLSDE